MEDLISRQNLLRNLRRFAPEHFNALVNDLILKEPSAQRWIPCNEVSGKGYPKENGFYYVTEQNYGFYLDADTRQKVAHTSHFKNGEFSDRYYDENHSNIVAWMPLPKPYEAERKEE
jgi:hypothetical protein